MESLVRISNNWALWPFRQLFTCAVERFYQTVLGKIVNNLLSRTLPLFPEVEEWGLRTMNMITYLKVYTKLRWNEGRSIAYFTCILYPIPCAEFDLSITKGKRTYWGCTWLLTKLVKSCPLTLRLLCCQYCWKTRLWYCFKTCVHAIQKIDRVCTCVLLCDCKINVIDHVGCFYGRGRGVAVQVT